MSDLKDQLRTDMTAAMKSGDKAKVSTLRMAMAAVLAKEKSGSAEIELDDEDVVAVLKAQIKQRKESVEAFQKGGRTEQAAAEEAEIEVLSQYVPAGLSPEQLSAIVDGALAEGGFSGPSDMGAAMKAAMAAVGGQADGKEVSALVKARLTS